MFVLLIPMKLQLSLLLVLKYIETLIFSNIHLEIHTSYLIYKASKSVCCVVHAHAHASHIQRVHTIASMRKYILMSHVSCIKQKVDT